jgi:DNA adenine methylase
MKTKLKTTALAPVFGSNRLNAALPGVLLQGCKFIAVAFAGGLPEVAGMKARTIIVNDRHSHIINLAMVAADSRLGPALRRKLKRLAFHPLILLTAQHMCRGWEEGGTDKWNGITPILPWAVDYFVCAWMARNGTAATDGEFTAGMSIRWDAGGGDSCVRFRSATESLREWQSILARCTFTCMDAFHFLDQVKDTDGHGLYCDPPWPTDGFAYKHKFTEKDQRRLAEKLTTYKKAKVVVRYGDHPLIRELYREPHWTWREVTGRTQTNDAKREVLLMNWAA